MKILSSERLRKAQIRPKWLKTSFSLMSLSTFVLFDNLARKKEQHTNGEILNFRKMTTKQKVKIDFSRFKDHEFLVMVQTVIAAMTGNENFETPTPALEDIVSLLEDYSDKLSIARKRRSPEDTALKNESRIPLMKMMQQLAYYVNSVAAGRLSALLSSGLPIGRENSQALVPLAVQGVKLSDGRQSGQVRLNFESQKNIRVYEYCYRKVSDPEEEWSDRFVTTSSRGNIIAPLEVAKLYEVKVRAINTQGTGDWSQTVSILVR